MHRLHVSLVRHLAVRKTIPFLLADIGEGIAEVQVLRWFVKPGQRVEQFDPIAEVQSDKAAVEITSRYDGTVRKLHYGDGAMAKVGRPLIDIEIDEDVGDIKGPKSDSESKPTGPRTATFVDDTRSNVVPLTAFQRAMVKSMTESLHIPHFGYHDYVPAPERQRKALHVTALPIYIKTFSDALRAFPVLNGSLVDNERVALHPDHNVGVAMATEHGLAVPVIRMVQQKPVSKVAEELRTLSSLAKENRLRQEHLEGGTITISNIGSIGGHWANPIIFAPQVCIVAIGRGNGENVPVSFSADHRVVDGATVARFCNHWKTQISTAE